MKNRLNKIIRVPGGRVKIQVWLKEVGSRYDYNSEYEHYLLFCPSGKRKFGTMPENIKVSEDEIKAALMELWESMRPDNYDFLPKF